MSGVMLLTPGTKASLVSERLRVQPPAGEEGEEVAARDIPLVDVDHVLLGEHAALTTPALAELLRREIPVLVVASGLRLLGVCAPPAALSVARLAQFRRTEDPAFVRDVSAALVAAKLLNQRRVLQRLAANRTDVAVGGPLNMLEQLAARSGRVGLGACDELRGIEGAGARCYFEALSGFFPPGAPMNGRTRQPPKDAPNAVLSYAYTIMTGEMTCHIHAVGLDPAVGCYHEPEDRRAALALDLIEPFRAPVADALALDLFSHGQLQPREHFEERDGGVFLNLAGRKRFHLAYERRLERAFKSRESGEHTTLRGEMRACALAIKMSIVESRPFAPFRMN
jgi:CRISPR-associated endonuclease Cas1